MIFSSSSSLRDLHSELYFAAAAAVVLIFYLIWLMPKNGAAELYCDGKYDCRKVTKYGYFVFMKKGQIEGLKIRVFHK